jgi:hypothetical protein
VPIRPYRSAYPHRRSIMTLLVTLFLVLAPAVTRAQDGTPIAGSAVKRAAAWLLAQQGPDGGFVGLSGTSDAGTTADAILALAAARNTGLAIDLKKAVDYLEQNALVYTQSGPGQAAKLVLAVVAAGGDPTDIARVDPLSIVQVSARSETGLIGFGPFDHALGVLALVATGTDVPPAAIDVFRTTQLDDGSWSFDGTTANGGGDTNTTAIVIQALAAAGQGEDPMVARALDYLKSTQTAAGGFPYQRGQTPKGDANSTAIAVQAILAVGQDPASADWKDAASALAAFQNPSGAFRYTDDESDDNLFATVQAIPAIAGQPYPIAARAGGDGTDFGTPLAA